jgi:hypothetical protein
MRVSIQHSQKTTGLLVRHAHYCVALSVQFTEEEHHVLRQLKDVIILERGPDSLRHGKFTPEEETQLHETFSLKASDLLRRTDSYYFATPGEAHAYEQTLKDSLRQFKSYLEANAVPPSGSDVFEL